MKLSCLATLYPASCRVDDREGVEVDDPVADHGAVDVEGLGRVEDPKTKTPLAAGDYHPLGQPFVGEDSGKHPQKAFVGEDDEDQDAGKGVVGGNVVGEDGSS